MSWVDDLPKPKGERSISINVSAIYRYIKKLMKKRRTKKWNG